MKAYIKPQTEVVEISVENNLMQASGVSVISKETNEQGTGRAKTYTFDIWGEDEEQ